jgi:RES domain-containing protein
MLTIYIPDDISIYQIQEKNLPTDWNKFPPSISTQAFGDNFVKDNKYCILKVPSTVTKGDFNLLINPKHDKFSEIKIINTEDFIFDNRLFK